MLLGRHTAPRIGVLINRLERPYKHTARQCSLMGQERACGSRHHLNVIANIFRTSYLMITVNSLHLLRGMFHVHRILCLGHHVSAPSVAAHCHRCRPHQRLRLHNLHPHQQTWLLRWRRIKRAFDPCHDRHRRSWLPRARLQNALGLWAVS